MLETNVPVTKDSSDCIFIDRSPKHFEKILNYMRDGEMDLPESEEDVKEIQKEARFYLLDGLVELCEPVGTIEFLESASKSIVNAITKCKKTAVIIVSYKTELGISECSKLAGILDNHGDKFDVYLNQKHTTGHYNPMLHIHDKKTGLLHLEYLDRLKDKLKSLYGIEI